MQTERVSLYSYTLQVEFRFARLVQSELCVTFPHSIGFVDVTTASLLSETDIYESPDLAFSFPLRRYYPQKSASRNASGTTVFFKATQKELLGQQLFSKLAKSYDREFLEA